MNKLKQQPSQKAEILWNITNAALAGVLVLLGAFTTGSINKESFCAALVAALIVAITQFKDYWMGEAKEYKATKIFKFI